jgi:hypothetical protein
MKINSWHEMEVAVDPARAGALLDSLSGPDDRLWPHENWPPLELDQPLGVGARGGHGPVRYSVIEYVPGRRVVFNFDDDGIFKRVEGRHWFELGSDQGATGVVMRHVIEARGGLKSWLLWLVAVQPLHDAVVRDAWDKARTNLGQPPDKPAQWSRWVRFLRKALAPKAA